MHDFKIIEVKTSLCQKLSLMLSSLELETFCVFSRREHRSTLGLVPRSSNFISNVGLTRNKMHDFKFSQVKTSFCQKISLMLCRHELEPSACSAEMITVTPQHLAISAWSSNFISIVGLTRNKMLDFKLNQVKTSMCRKLSLILSGGNWRTSACFAEVITVTPQHLSVSPLSSNFIPNVGLTRSKMLDLNFNQVKKHHFVKHLH